jgi:hypothetical protein
MIRSHEALLELIRYYGLEGGDGEAAVEILAEIDKTLFDLYDTLERVRVLSAIGALEGCRGCDEALAIIKGELGDRNGPSGVTQARPRHDR